MIELSLGTGNTAADASFRIRRSSRDDSPKIADMCSSKEVYDSFLSMPFLHRELWNDMCASAWDLPLVLIAEKVSDSELLGLITLTANGKNRRQSHMGLIGVAVNSRVQRQGIGDALLGQMLSVADAYYQMKRLEAVIWTENVRSLRLFEKHRFVIEGTMTAWAAGPDGYCDAYLCARIHPSLQSSTPSVTNLGRGRANTET
jgi:L-phenylalanine/L-methionine N-acetyltransferase